MIIDGDYYDDNVDDNDDGGGEDEDDDADKTFLLWRMLEKFYYKPRW